MIDRIVFPIIDLCVWNVDTSRVSVTLAVLILLPSMLVGWDGGVYGAGLAMAVVVASAVVLLIVSAAWPDLARRWNGHAR